MIMTRFPAALTLIVYFTSNPAEPEILSGRHHIHGWRHHYNPDNGVPD
jgi:hypothetical protein